MKRLIFALIVKFLIICFSIQLIADEKKDHKSKSEGMVRIPAGSFQMGDHFKDGGQPDELPVHTVYISEFWMDKYEITNSEYKKCVDAGFCHLPENKASKTRNYYFGNPHFDNFPVIKINWDDANSFCQWKGKRLPTEAKWEYAARGGLANMKYLNGNSIDKKDANVDGIDTSQVGIYLPNGYGLYDMTGNVWEFVNDWYDEKYYTNSPLRDPCGPKNGKYHVLRGGCWNNDIQSVRVSERGSDVPAYADYGLVGFRCAK